MPHHRRTAVPTRRALSRSGSKPKRIRIIVADSQAIDRGGIVRLVEDEHDLEVVGEAASVAEAIQQCRALEPDVLVLSLNLPDQEQNAAIPAIRAAAPAIRIVALSERGTSTCLVLNPPSRPRKPAEIQVLCRIGIDCLQLAVTQGAMATLRRDADPEDLFRAIRAVARGTAWYDASTAAGLLSSTSRPGTEQWLLSTRELDVAALIADGLSNKEISTALEISEPTVKKHVGHILSKLGIADRLQAGLLLARNPLLLKR
jgi:two-component system NarL family response regulator